MNLTNLELFSFETRDIVTDFDEDNKVIGTRVENNKGTVSYGIATGELKVDNPDGTGFSLTVNPILTNKLMEWVSSNIKKANEQDQIYCKQRDEEHAERMRKLELETKEAELRLEEAQLKHEIRLVELKIELAEKRKELREAEKEAADEIIGDGKGES